jgi:predicted metal-dependent phosphoesterase TrpH
MLKTDLHIHSFSRKRLTYCPFLYDSVQTVNEIIQQALDSGVQILSITDHDTLAGSQEAARIVQSRGLDLVLIPGCEISSADGHILAYNIQTEIPKGLTAGETIKHIHGQGGYAVAAHPFLIGSLRNQVFDLPFDALEGFNAAVSLLANFKSMDAAEKLQLPYLANSDAHQIEEIGRSHMLFPENTQTAHDLFGHLRAGNFVCIHGRTNNLHLTWRHLYRNLQLHLRHGLPVPESR